MRPLGRLFVIALASAAVACVAAGEGGGSAGVGPAGGKADRGASEQGRQDVLSTALAIDLAGHRGVAEIATHPSADGEVRLAVGDLAIDAVTDGERALEHVIEDGELRVRVPAGAAAHLHVEYAFADHARSDGWLPSSGTTLLWPYFCGNLFPCSPEPRDGLRFTLALAGVPEGRTAVYPTEIPADAPPYMLAFAVGDYVYEELGTTRAGTKVGVYYHRGDATIARAGTEHLAGVFEFLETTYGPYTFGSSVASVSADWGGGAYGGMEHHPLWHVARGAMGDAETHAHEAAHGWFGNGVRIRCWEDFVLSEGTTSYAAARALEVAGGAEEGERVWASYRETLEEAVASGDTRAWPEGCDAIDILHDPLWSSIPYMKGAFFLRAIAEQVGAEELDRALARFYQDRVGTAAGVQDLLDTIEEETGLDPAPLAESWLRGRGIPEAN